eukprot:8449933-Prorocentrum_lima.AAC.1
MEDEPLSVSACVFVETPTSTTDDNGGGADADATDFHSGAMAPQMHASHTYTRRTCARKYLPKAHAGWLVSCLVVALTKQAVVVHL